MKPIRIDDGGPVYLLDSRPVFPPPERARDDGLLAVGGDLSPARLLEAYRLGIFPWFDEGDPILWWSPDPRLVLEPDELKVSRSLRATLRKRTFEVRCDTAFARVIHACAATPRKDEEGTWIAPEVESAYTALHDLGYAHSVEAWCEGELAGGLYGVMLGRCFFGESMFSTRADASKVALVGLARLLRSWDVGLIDCQITSPHLLGLGAKEVSRRGFLGRLRDGLRFPTRREPWPDLPAEPSS